MWIAIAGMAGTAGVTIAYISYRFGQLETRVLLKLSEHERRLKKLEASPLALHGIVQ